MIIRTYMSERAAANQRLAAPRLSDRELRRLAHTKHSKGKMPEVVEEVKEEIPVVEEVREEIVEEIKEEPAAVVEPIEELEQPAVEPGTARIRSKALEEIENSFKKEPAKVPLNKYKVISIGK